MWETGLLNEVFRIMKRTRETKGRPSMYPFPIHEYRAKSVKSFTLFKNNVLKRNFHGRTLVNLKGEQSFSSSGFLIIVNKLHCFYSVYVVSKLKAFGGNLVLVPFSLFNGFPYLSRLPKFFHFLL